MAFNDFYRGIPAPLAQEIDALALVVYRCRTAANDLLHAEGVSDLDVWQKRLRARSAFDSHEEWERYLSAAVLCAQWERARCRLAEKLREAQGEQVAAEPLEPLALDAVTGFLAETGEAHGVTEWERLLDAVRCRLENGVTLWVRYATPDAYSFVWQAGDGAMERIDTAPHREWAGQPHRHSASGSVVADTLTSAAAQPEENLRQVLRHLNGVA